MEKLWDLKIKKITLPSRDIERINNLIYYGAHFVAQREYEFVRPAYDEDAGIFTDQGMNETARTWANIHFTQLVTTAILDVKYSEQTENQTAEVYLLELAISALVQILTVCLHDDVQRSILNRMLGDEYESDGHYTGQKRQEYIEKRITEEWLDRKTMRQIIDKLMDLRNAETLRTYLKRIHGKKNESQN